MNQVLQGKAALITGANQGLGLAIAHSYVRAGASVAICARDAALLAQARSALELKAGEGQRIVAVPADVSKPDQVNALMRAAELELGGLDVLVNNAGVYGPKGAIDEIDWDDWVRAIEVNLHGSVLMAKAVLPHFKAKGAGKIIQLSGGGATKPLPRLSAYAVSKAAIIRFVETLAEEVRAFGIDVNAIAPGALNTRMLQEILEAGPAAVGKDFYDRSVRQEQRGGDSLDVAAELAVFLGSSLSDGITGKLISASWDPWRSLADHIEDLKETDIYTLRRIVPGDRGKSWGTGS